jgi:ABC-2 type transport system permease protein
VGGYTAPDFAAYYLAMMVVNQVTYTWVMYEFDYRVRQGSLSFALLRPLHPIHSDIADNLGSKVFSVPVMVAAAVALSLAFHPDFHPVPWSIAALLPALALAFVARFLVEWTLALAAFWTTRVSAFNQLYFLVALFLSGQIAPLALLPRWLRVAASVLPFRWFIAFPTELALGRLSPAEAATGLAALAAWAVAALAILRFVWRRGLRVYSAVGG